MYLNVALVCGGSMVFLNKTKMNSIWQMHWQMYFSNPRLKQKQKHEKLISLMRLYFFFQFYRQLQCQFYIYIFQSCFKWRYSKYVYFIISAAVW